MSRKYGGGITWGDLEDPDRLRALSNPLLGFDKCESAAFVRAAIKHAAMKDIDPPLSPYINLLPDEDRVRLSDGYRRTSSEILCLQTEEDFNRGGFNAAVNLSNARTWFSSAGSVPATVRPTMYYYGGLSFLNFVVASLVKLRSDKGSHGLSVSCGSDGWNFDKNWPRKECFVTFEQTGDFPQFVDILTTAGWPSLFSTFRLHRDNKDDPIALRANPSAIGMGKLSLDFLCKFDCDKYVEENGAVADWLEGESVQTVFRVTELLLDFAIVFTASSLSRYYVAAWNAITQGHKSAIYNQVRQAYRTVSQDMPLFFVDQYPFRYSFCD